MLHLLSKVLPFARAPLIAIDLLILVDTAGQQCLIHAPRLTPVRATGTQGAAIFGGLSGARPLGRSSLDGPHLMLAIGRGSG